MATKTGLTLRRTLVCFNPRRGTVKMARLKSLQILDFQTRDKPGISSNQDWWAAVWNRCKIWGVSWHRDKWWVTFNWHRDKQWVIFIWHRDKQWVIFSWHRDKQWVIFSRHRDKDQVTFSRHRDKDWVTRTGVQPVLLPSFGQVIGDLKQNTNIECPLQQFYKSWTHSEHTCARLLLHSAYDKTLQSRWKR